MFLRNTARLELPVELRAGTLARLFVDLARTVNRTKFISRERLRFLVKPVIHDPHFESSMDLFIFSVTYCIAIKYRILIIYRNI